MDASGQGGKGEGGARESERMSGNAWCAGLGAGSHLHPQAVAAEAAWRPDGETSEDVGMAMNELAKMGMVLGVAALPWGEVVFAIPLGIALGLHGVAVFALAVVGNVASVLALILGLRRWPWARDILVRRGRSPRMARMMARYGAAGLSAQAPIVSGGHLAALAALFLGANVRHVAGWLTLSIVGWGAAITLLAALGKHLVLGFLG